MARRAAEPRTGRVPTIAIVTALVMTVVGTTTMLLSVYSGLFNSDMWQIALALLFLTILPSRGWGRKPKRRT